MKRMFRRLYRIPALIAWILLYSAIAVSVRFGKKEDERIQAISPIVQKWAKGLLRILNIRLIEHGSLTDYRKEGGLIVSNHLGYVDVLVHGALTGMRFAPKAEVKHWPFFGWFTGLSSPIWIDRTSRQKSYQVLQEFRRTIRLHVPLIVYPEGTSSDGFHGLLPFKGTAFETVVGTDIPIMPLITLYTTLESDDMNPAWFGDWEFLPHLWQLLGNRGALVDVYILPLVYAEGRTRKDLAQFVYEKMDKVYQQKIKKEMVM